MLEPSIILSIEGKQTFARVREWRVPDVMQECGEAYDPSVTIQSCLIVVSASFQIMPLPRHNSIVHPCGDVHRAQRMFEPGMSRSRIYKICKGQLPDTSQTLKCRMVDDFSFPVIEFNESVDRVSDIETRHDLRALADIPQNDEQHRELRGLI